MLNEEQTANIVTLIEDLEVDLRNGNIPKSRELITSLANNLANTLSLNWRMLESFTHAYLEEAETRAALLHFLPKLREIICPFQPSQEETQG